MTVKMTIVQEISRPVSDDKTRNLSKWLDDECEQCTAQRERSGLKRRLEKVNWEQVAAQKKFPGVVSMKTEPQSILIISLSFQITYTTLNSTVPKYIFSARYVAKLLYKLVL